MACHVKERIDVVLYGGEKSHGLSYQVVEIQRCHILVKCCIAYHVRERIEKVSHGSEKAHGLSCQGENRQGMTWCWWCGVMM